MSNDSPYQSQSIDATFKESNASRGNDGYAMFKNYSYNYYNQQKVITMVRYLALASIIVLVSSCTWVRLTPEGEGVVLGNARLIENCDRLGRVTARTLSEVVTVERGGGKLQSELLTLARNEAGIMGGNTIVPESLIEDGEQGFGVYSCP